MSKPQLIDKSAPWQALSAHYKQLSPTTLSALFDADPQRGKKFSASAHGIYFDYSKNLLTETTLDLLEELANVAQLSTAIESLFTGAHINTSEDRPALHTVLRSADSTDSKQTSALHTTRQHTNQLADKLRKGLKKSSTGQAFRNVVSIGIGGSDLGPRLVASAFPEMQAANIRTHFVANIDSDVLQNTLTQCKPETTLFLISSKSFSTLETLSNAEQARQWLLDAGLNKEAIKHHLIAMTSKTEKALAWGIAPEHIFPMPDGVGGRFSLWSSIGLPIAIAIGPRAFNQLLAGARDMDEHFRNTPFRQNLPALHGLLSIWSTNFNQHRSRAVLPYIHRLRELPSYLQQLSMESLGKRTSQNGQPCTYTTGTVIWGSEGTNGQHSFHQLLLQGSETQAVEFIASATPHCKTLPHKHLLANCFAQSRALMLGKSQQQALAEGLSQGLSADAAATLADHKAIPGNRPSNTLLLKEFTPRTLGALLALYEHSTYVQSVIWGINAFDQWAVELGKTMSASLFDALEHADTNTGFDSSTQSLLDHIKNIH